MVALGSAVYRATARPTSVFLELGEGAKVSLAPAFIQLGPFGRQEVLPEDSEEVHQATPISKAPYSARVSWSPFPQLVGREPTPGSRGYPSLLLHRKPLGASRSSAKAWWLRAPKRFCQGKPAVWGGSDSYLRLVSEGFMLIRSPVDSAKGPMSKSMSRFVWQGFYIRG